MSGSVRRCVALCVVHGIGSQKKDWADQFVTSVRREVAGRNPEIDIYPLVVWWSPVTQRYEDRLTARYRGGLSWRWLRRLVIDYGGDVIAYQSPAGRDAPWTYEAVHRRIDRRLRALRASLEQTAAAEPGIPVPLVVVAHSLGSVIFSDFVYDAQARGAAGGAFAQRYGLVIRALYTAGSPLALYAIRYRKLGFDRPIALEGGTWVNVLYKSDVIAYPLRPASPAYADAVAEDWTLTARWWPPLVYRTPFAHLAYWNDGRFIRRVAGTLARAAEPVVG